MAKITKPIPVRIINPERIPAAEEALTRGIAKMFNTDIKFRKSVMQGVLGTENIEKWQYENIRFEIKGDK